jgi:hypothetical protein
MIVIKTYRSNYKIPSELDLSIELGSRWLTGSLRLRWFYKREELYIKESGDYYGEDLKNYDDILIKELCLISSFIYERLHLLQSDVLDRSNPGAHYNLNDAIHSMLIDKSFFRDRIIDSLLY